MQLPIIGRLKEDVKFDFETLAENVEQTDEFWEWWWEERACFDSICRPETIADNDEILTETIYKPVVNLCCYREFFERTLFKMTEIGVFPSKEISRDSFHKLALRIAANASTKFQDRPQMVFAGGGYGSGKTFAINHLCDIGFLPFEKGHLVGADIFKQLIPEYSLIKAVADGRASKTVQKECMRLADELFTCLTEAGRSFVWDSSMSNKEATLERIRLAKKNNYEITMIAVLTPLEVAVKQAMRRAKATRRFPHPAALPDSHVGFRRAFNDYIDLFDEIKVIANMGGDSDSEVVAEKLAGKKFEIANPDLFNALMIVPPAAA